MTRLLPAGLRPRPRPRQVALQPLRVIIAPPDTKAALRPTRNACCAGHEKQWFNFTHLCQLAKLRWMCTEPFALQSRSSALRCFRLCVSMLRFPCLKASSLVRAKRSCNFVSAEGPFSCLGGEASREAEAGGSLAAQTCLQSARRAACFKSRQRLPPRPVFVVKNPPVRPWCPHGRPIGS